MTARNLRKFIKNLDSENQCLKNMERLLAILGKGCMIGIGRTNTRTHKGYHHDNYHSQHAFRSNTV